MAEMTNPPTAERSRSGLRLNVSWKLVIPFIVIIVATSTVFLPIANRTIERILITDVDQRLVQTAESFAHLLEHSEFESQLVSNFTANLDDVQDIGGDAQVAAQVLQPLKQELGVQELSYYAADYQPGGSALYYGGPVIVRRNQISQSVIDHRDALIAETIATGETASGIAIAPGSSQIIGVSPVFLNGQMNGVILAAFIVNADYIEEIGETLNVDAAIVKDNAPIASTIDDGSGYELLLQEGFIDPNQEFTATNIEYADGISRRLLSHELVIDGEIQGHVLLARETQNRIALQNQIQNIIFVFLAALIIIMASFGIAVIFNFARPLRRLLEATGKVREGDFTQYIEVGNFLFRDEVSDLTENFNAMTSDLQALYADLEQKVAERTFEMSYARDTAQSTTLFLNALLNNLVDGLLVMDTEGNITLNNPALSEMFGLTGTDLFIRGKRAFVDPAMYSLIEQVGLNPEGTYTAEVGLVNQRIGQAVATPIFKDDGDGSVPELIGSVMLIRDITHEKEIDQMKTDFISTVSHELRTPLTSVLGFAKIIKKRLTETIFVVLQTDDKKVLRAIKQVNNNLDIILAEGGRLTDLINDVLDIAKMEAGRVEWNMQATSIPELVDHAVASTTALFDQKPSVRLKTHVDPGIPMLTADADRIIQVIINLISNAWKFTEAGTVTCEVRDEDKYVVVRVSDTGIGIRPEDQAAVFERFKQIGDTITDKPTGTGLGLPICKQIVEHHGGKIWVESNFGNGSTFAFSLPKEAAASKFDTREMPPVPLGDLVMQLKEKVVHNTQQDHDGNGAKEILIVDDEAPIREMLRQELESEGYNVREARDGVEAMRQVKEQRPDLIILDVMMPNINGFDVLAMLKTDLDMMDVPIIILSIVEDRDKGYRLGVDRYLTKPVNTQRLLSEMEALLTQEHSRKRVMVLNENNHATQTLTELLTERGYQVVVLAKDDDLVARARETRPDMVVANSLDPDRQRLVQALRFEKGLEDIYILLYQE